MDIEVFPYRILGADTTEKLLNGIERLDAVKRTVIQGPRLPPKDTNENSKYDDRRNITVNGKELELKIKTGRIFVEISNEANIDEIKKICSDHLPFGFDINVGKYIRTQRTVSDNIKYGDADIPDELIGITDQSAKLKDSISIIKNR
jgi:methyl-coenzyme M reductase subunit D